MTVLHPAYLPNVAFFCVYTKANDVVFEKQDNYQKQTYRNRAYICTDRGKHLLSIPIVHKKGATGRQHYKEVKLDNSYAWQRQHWRTLETAYRTSPFFEFYEDELRPLFGSSFEYLLDFNLKTIETVCDMVQVDMPINTSEKFEVAPDDVKDYRMLVNSKRKFGVEYPTYNQVFGDRHGFITDQSILDLLFNKGPESTSYLNKINLDVLND